jgi:hypothetical protein
VLAPVLARLRRIPGIADARVECSGTFFALSLGERADPEATLRAVLDVLGPGSRRLLADEAGAQLAARASGEIWFSEEEIRALSYIEGRIIAGRALAAATRGLEVTGAETDRIRDAIRVEVFAALDRVHDEGGRSSSGWFTDEWPHIVTRVRSRLAGALDGPALAHLAAQLLELH